MTGVRALDKGRSGPHLGRRGRIDWGPGGEVAGWRMGLMGARCQVLSSLLQYFSQSNGTPVLGSRP